MLQPWPILKYPDFRIEIRRIREVTYNKMK